MPPRVTVLTDPVPAGLAAALEFARGIARMVARTFKPLPPFLRSDYRGHFAVTRSVVEGLQKIGVSVNYNPRSLVEIADTVVVLAGVPAMRQAIRLKREGRIKTLLVGPNIYGYPSDHRQIVWPPEVDYCVTACEWVKQLYVDDCPELSGRCVAWPAGVDTEFWRPQRDPRQAPIALIFEKQNKGSVGPIEEYANVLRAKGYTVEVITYGHFDHRQYLEALRRSALMIGFVRDESQGIAWAEAWSTNVPTLIWRNERNFFQGRSFACSTAPYLAAENGLFFDGPADFPKVLAYWEGHREQFKPREWVLRNMSDEVCARRLLEIAEGRAPTALAGTPVS